MKNLQDCESGLIVFSRPYMLLQWLAENVHLTDLSSVEFNCTERAELSRPYVNSNPSCWALPVSVLAASTPDLIIMYPDNWGAQGNWLVANKEFTCSRQRVQVISSTWINTWTTRSVNSPDKRVVSRTPCSIPWGAVTIKTSRPWIIIVVSHNTSPSDISNFSRFTKLTK